jgi:hypothetical protein
MMALGRWLRRHSIPMDGVRLAVELPTEGAVYEAESAVLREVGPAAHLAAGIGSMRADAVNGIGLTFFTKAQIPRLYSGRAYVPPSTAANFHTINVDVFRQCSRAMADGTDVEIVVETARGDRMVKGRVLSIAEGPIVMGAHRSWDVAIREPVGEARHAG